MTRSAGVGTAPVEAKDAEEAGEAPEQPASAHRLTIKRPAMILMAWAFYLSQLDPTVRPALRCCYAVECFVSSS